MTAWTSTTPDEIRALIERATPVCEKATPGPWAYFVLSGLSVPMGDAAFLQGPTERYADKSKGTKSEDATFIATARTDLPRALALLSAALERIEALEQLDREAATHVESVICMRTAFTGDEPYVGWKGLGLALNEALDDRDALKVRAESAEASLANALRVGDQMATSAITLSIESDGSERAYFCNACVHGGMWDRALRDDDHAPDCPVALWRAMPRAGS